MVILIFKSIPLKNQSILSTPPREHGTKVGLNNEKQIIINICVNSVSVTKNIIMKSIWFFPCARKVGMLPIHIFLFLLVKALQQNTKHTLARHSSMKQALHNDTYNSGSKRPITVSECDIVQRGFKGLVLSYRDGRVDSRHG